jgi:tetratricopeptide (TPR) repeat protein
LIALSIAAFGCAALTIQQTSYWRDSIALFERTLSLTKNNTSGEYFMALAYESKHKNAEAVPHFIEAIRGNNTNIKAITHLGRIYAEQGKLDDAKKQFEAALNIDTDLPLTQMNLGDVLMRQNKRDEAIEHYITAMQLNPGIPQAHYELSNLLASKHDYDGAISHLKTAIQLKPEWPIALNSLAWMLATQQNPKLREGHEAVRLAELAVALTKKDPGMVDTLAAAYAEAGRFPEAIKTAETAIQLATASNQASLAAEIKTRLQLYQAGTAYRE